MSKTNSTVKPEQRVDLARHSGQIYQQMAQFGSAVEAMGLERSLMELVKIRASQINHCAFCIDMHTLDATEYGETQQRMHALSAWRETPFFTARERAALAYTEAATLIAQDGVPDEVFDQVSKHFDESEAAALVWLVAVINTWNRVAIPARVLPGQYRPGQFHSVEA